MRKVLQVYLGILFLSISYAAGSSFAGLEGDVYKASYVCYDLKGHERWRADAEIRHKEGDVYCITEKMRGRYSGFDGKISWVATTNFERTKDTVKPLNMDQRIFDGSGRMIAVNRQDFNYADRVVTCTYNDLVRNRVVKKSFAFSKDIINRMLQGLYVQKFIENGLTFKEMQVISPEPAVYNISLRLVGAEEVEINGRVRKTYKICFDPMLGLLNFVKIFLPKAYTWHSSEPIFEWLKYEGVESSINSPEVEIVSLDDDAPKSIPIT